MSTASALVNCLELSTQKLTCLSQQERVLTLLTLLLTFCTGLVIKHVCTSLQNTQILSYCFVPGIGILFGVVRSDAMTTCNVIQVNDIVVLLFDSHGQMKRAHDAYRTRLWFALMVVGTFLFYRAMVSGRRLRDSGYNLEEEGSKQVAVWREKGRLEREAQKKKAAE